MCAGDVDISSDTEIFDYLLACVAKAFELEVKDFRHESRSTRRVTWNKWSPIVDEIATKPEVVEELLATLRVLLTVEQWADLALRSLLLHVTRAATAVALEDQRRGDRALGLGAAAVAVIETLPPEQREAIRARLVEYDARLDMREGGTRLRFGGESDSSVAFVINGKKCLAKVEVRCAGRRYCAIVFPHIGAHIASASFSLPLSLSLSPVSCVSVCLSVSLAFCIHCAASSRDCRG